MVTREEMEHGTVLKEDLQPPADEDEAENIGEFYSRSNPAIYIVCCCSFYKGKNKEHQTV